MPTVLKIMAGALTERQYAEIDTASQREFGVSLPGKPGIADQLYFLVTEAVTGKLLASGYLKPISPVWFGQETYAFLNIGGIIANEKGKGFGKQIMTAMRAYLLAHDRTGLGFCFPNNRGFYEKCGFKVDPTATKQFIYRDGADRLTAEPQCVLYLESSDRFMEKVLANPSQEVYVPDPSIW